ncbi:hypothetical protein GO495_06700 [Chitinophaga oryziterrae]|uniref:Uncharacterized protein n=1 Tax=Chitinophaga oryziterrae TaxID=1031224 RepID=A0A6N8J5R2_9BACT|nr:hypothetical protein [Chitinophaga oryziterrae]MVT40264.1 hypothetical protein [Chitinophaga oryziterrae]
MRIQFNPSVYFDRSVEGWTVEVTGLETAFTTEESIKGKIIASDKKGWFDTDKLYLDCKIRTGQIPEKVYTLFTLNPNGTATSLEVVEHSQKWAIDFWDEIKAFFAKNEFADDELIDSNHPIYRFSDFELINEVNRRGIFL